MEVHEIYAPFQGLKKLFSYRLGQRLPEGIYFNKQRNSC
jgi:hypothetical protein